MSALRLAGLGARGLGEDVDDGGGPDEPLAIVIVMLDVSPDHLFEIALRGSRKSRSTHETQVGVKSWLLQRARNDVLDDSFKAAGLA